MISSLDETRTLHKTLTFSADMRKQRKISNISNSNDSGYNEKASDDSNNSIQEIRVQSVVSLRGKLYRIVTII